MLVRDNTNDQLGIHTGKFDPDLPAAYQQSAPFPHLVIDNLLPSEIAEAAYLDFPNSQASFWQQHGRFYEKSGVAAKLESTAYQHYPVSLQQVVDLLNSKELLSFLWHITGYTDLEYDPTLTGGGLNLVRKDGMLKIHADFNYSNELQAYRTVNLIYYLNKHWEEADGGCLELWNETLSGPSALIIPKFNRAAIFSTNSKSFHGYKAVTGMKDGGRKSINFYYYSKVARKDVHPEPHKTLWQDDI